MRTIGILTITAMLAATSAFSLMPFTGANAETQKECIRQVNACLNFCHTLPEQDQSGCATDCGRTLDKCWANATQDPPVKRSGITIGGTPKWLGPGLLDGPQTGPAINAPAATGNPLSIAPPSVAPKAPGGGTTR